MIGSGEPVAGPRRAEAMKVLLAAVLGGLVTGLVLLGIGALLGVRADAVGADGPGAAEVRAIYRTASPAVLAVDAGDRTGSGFLIDDAGHLVTNAHVVGDQDDVEVVLGGRRIGAHVRGVEPSVDVAVLELGAPAGDVAPLVFADSSELRVGDPVIAIGTPFGLEGSLSTGIVSGLRRQIDSPNGFAITGVIQTDAALNPGNSGGPILDTSGRVVGVATQIASEGGRNEGIGFAIPSSVVRRTAERIIATGRASLPYLGIVGGDEGDGVALQDVLPGGPAVGLLRPGDVITAVDGDPVTSNAALAAALADRRPGEQVSIAVLRDGDPVEVPVTLAERPPGGP